MQSLLEAMQICIQAVTLLILLTFWLFSLAGCAYGVRICLQIIADRKSCAFDRIVFAVQTLLCVALLAFIVLLPLQKIVERYGELS